VIAGSAQAGAVGKSKPGPVSGSYTASATPDPSSAAPGRGVCDPVTEGGKDTHPFKVPAAGVLHVELANTLDWSLAVRDGAKTLASSDGASSTDKEQVDVLFKAAESVTFEACNFTGEPEVAVSYTFTYS
jgi:hypothetical protein